MTAKTADQYRDAMVNALEDVERLSNIIRALLMLSQAESGQLVLKKTDVDLVEALGSGGAASFQFASKGHDLFASVEGRLSPDTSRETIDKLWNPFIAAWYARSSAADFPITGCGTKTCRRADMPLVAATDRTTYGPLPPGSTRPPSR